MEKANSNLIFILKYTKHVWKKLNQPTLALSVLRDEYEKNPESEHLCLALQKLLRAESQFLEAEELLKRGIAGKFENSQRVWLQAVQLQRQLNNHQQALVLVNQALEKFSTNFKLWLMKAQILQIFGPTDAVREAYECALQVSELRSEAKLWIAASDFEI